MKKKIFKLLNIHTQEDFDAWAKDNGIKAEDIDWEKPNANAAFVKALSKDSPALAHALANNYDFGAYQPDLTKRVTFDDDRGNWDAQTVQGWWGSTDPAWAQVLEAHPELTQDTHLTREELADYLRNTDAFKRGTQWLQDSPENRLAYLQRIINNPNAPAKAVAYAKKFADKNGWLPDAATDYETIFNNPSGRAANPGTYWKTPIEVARGNEARNWVIDEDGTVKEIVGDVPEDWTAAGNYSWATPENDYVYNYYTRGNDQVVTPEGKPQDTVTTSEEELEPVPVYKNGNLRYAGLLGPAVGLELMAAGVGRPDNSYWDEAVSSIGSPVLAGYKTAGEYMTYKPDDPWFYTSPILANSGAADRSILNSGVNQGTKNAGIVANGYNTNLTLGQATRQALEHNYEKDLRRTTHNTGVEQFNAQAFNQNQQFNAEALNGFRRMAGQMRMQAASEKAQGDQGWYNSLYGNVGSFFKGLSDLGRENEQHNMIAEMAADGLFGTMSPNTNVGKRGKYLTWRKKQV